ncbi:MAG: CRTAC1 family protein [Alphaproteobacteria bacterium]|nr:CRTAC1 family protein [Alphaproteobacteria bacterium]
MSAPPTPDEGERQRLASSFSFQAEELFAPPVTPGTVHGVSQYAPYLAHYLHAVGSSISMSDLDGDGLPNDLCYTDVQAKAVVIAPAPGTGARYAPYSYDFGELFDARRQFFTNCLAVDANEDGWMDLVVARADATPILMLRIAPEHGGPQTPVQSAFKVGPLMPEEADGIWATLTMTAADIDGDGHDDLIVGNYFADDVPVHDPDQANYFEMNDGFNWAENGGTNRVLLWSSGRGGPDPEAHYVDAGDVFPDARELRWTLAIAAGDVDMDGLSDLYVSNDHGPDDLFLNRSTPGHVQLVAMEGEKGFFTPRSMMLGHDTFKGMGADFADINDDGTFDIFVSNIGSDFGLGETHFLWVSDQVEDRLARGVAPYTNRSVTLGVSHSGWAWESIFDDFDNDGVDELVQATGFLRGTENAWNDLGNFGLMNDRLVKDPANWPYLPEGRDVDGWDPNPFYARDATGRYVDLSGLLMPGLTPNTRGIATADVDGDGDLDMAYANHLHSSVYLRNDAPNPGSQLTLNLLHPVSEDAWGVQVRDGSPHGGEGSPVIGALVKVKTPDGRTHMRQLDGGNGHTGQRSHELHFGLGALPADATVPVEIQWRDREGVLHEDSMELAPGRHVVTLSPRTEPPAPVEPETLEEATP